MHILILKSVYVAFFSMFGVAIRVCAVWISESSPGILFPALFSNMVGCFLYGLMLPIKQSVLTQKRLFNHFASREAFIVGFTTGLCGCVTTFSSWMLSVAESFLNQQVSLAFMQLLVGFTLAFASLRVGTHLGQCLQPASPAGDAESSRQAAPAGSAVKASLLGTPLLLLFFATTLCLLLAVTVEPSRNVVLPMLFGPFGALVRFWTSPLNARVPSYPLGTFGVNVVGTGIVAAVLHANSDVEPLLAMQFVEAAAQGFGGSLTTVSTLMAEVDQLQRSAAYAYSLGTLIGGQAVALVLCALLAA